MEGIVTRRTIYSIAFLGVTALAVILELVFAFDGSPDTRPWTDFLTDLPWPVWAIASLTLSIWLPLHLWKYWRLKHPKGPTS